MSSSLETIEGAAPAPKLPLPARDRLHLDYLDGLRAVAALYVMAYHMKMAAMPGGRVASLTQALNYGPFAVSLFIVISGFCLMLPIVQGDGSVRGGAIHFYKKRARRILPPYYAALALSLSLYLLREYLSGSPFSGPPEVNAKGVITHLFLVHNIWLGTIYQINGPMWSIAVEWQIYFLFPALVLWWQRIGGLPTTLAALGVGYGVMYILNHTLYAGITPHYVGLFSLGMLGAAVAYSPQPAWQTWRKRVPWNGITFGTAFLLYVACFYVFTHVVPLHTLDILVGLFSMALLVFISLEGPNRVRAFLAWKPLAFLGTFSYSLYLLHVPLLLTLMRYGISPLHFSPTAGFLLLIFVGSPVLLGIAYLFFLGCERPFLSQPKP